MKAIAQSYMWWPRLNDDIEAQAQSCQICQTVRTSPPVAPLHPWTWLKRVWQRLHIDFAEKDGNNFLVVIGQPLEVVGGKAHEFNNLAKDNSSTA